MTGNIPSDNIDARSCNHCYSGKAISLTQSVCVFVALGTQHATLMYRIVICGLPCSMIIFHIILQMVQSSKKETLLILKYVSRYNNINSQQDVK